MALDDRSQPTREFSELATAASEKACLAKLSSTRVKGTLSLAWGGSAGVLRLLCSSYSLRSRCSRKDGTIGTEVDNIVK